MATNGNDYAALLQYLNKPNGSTSTTNEKPITPQSPKFSVCSFNPEDIRPLIDPSNISYFYVSSDSTFYNTITTYFCAHNDNISSFNVRVGKKIEPFDPLNVLGYKKDKNSNGSQFTLGLGTFKFQYIPDEDSTSISSKPFNLTVLHQSVGDPVGTNCGAVQMTSLLVFVQCSAPEGKTLLEKFCEAVNKWGESANHPKTYKIFCWDHKRQYWKSAATKIVRPAASVVLPTDLKKKIFDDVEDFTAEETARWYFEHGIPYKRSYLFFGPPGAGKSSLIAVIAGKLKRNLCFLQPSDPNMTDEALSSCILSAPKNSVVVIEDIDALFGKDRQTLSSKTPLTFSGLLNALDGVANPDGQIFILTTNYVDRLDSALIRAGRVDLRVEFGLATDEQIEGMFLHFYSGKKDLAKQFVEALKKRLEKERTEVVGKEEEEVTSGGVRISTAALQQHFIKCRTKSAEETVKLVETFDLGCVGKAQSG